ncbi:hypothetical protein QQS21_000296 [Conoideocrella luteorostrata]|uniref:Uncharacterized protein n=1 Tax=Conoideocrella luteorostrata TaxID=1105319 RepID=A0AAJ0FYJ6_9HYPO|nr:hypothetical protein QQS21_000296 [Conoideocrella luteorostrata]
MYRGGCTDTSFESKSCAKFCYGDNALYGVSAGKQQSGVWTCDRQKFACATSLCQTNNFTVPQGVILDNAALRADVGNLTSTTAVNPTCSATQAPTETECKAGISTGGAVGVGVGVGAPLALAAAALLVLLMQERRKTKASEQQNHDNYAAWTTSSQYVAAHTHGQDVNGKDTPRSEIMGTPRHEMGG